MTTGVARVPSVTVVVATRNRPEMLRAAVASITGQTYPGAVECLVVFDQSEPDTGLEASSPARAVRVLSNDRTPGLAGARNTGILAADRDLVAFCDDDDLWHPQKLATQVETMGDAPTSVTGVVIDYGGRRVERIPNRSAFTLENLVRHRLMEAHPSTVLMERTALVERIGLVDEDIPGSYGEDYDFILRAAQAGPVSVVEQALVDVRWGQSMFSRDWRTIIAAIDYMMGKHVAFSQDRRALARLYGRRAFANGALGNRREAVSDAWRAARASPREKRVYVSLLVASRLVSAPRLLDLAHRRGHGI